MAINMENKIQKMINESVIASYNMDEAHDLLARNNFMSDEDIWDVIFAADEPAWEFIYDNRTNYAKNIREMIEPRDARMDLSKMNIKMVVRDLTDADMLSIAASRKAMKRQEFETEWDELKKAIPCRPEDELDGELDDAWMDLMESKKRMTEYVTKKKGKYVAPSSRNAMDPEQAKIEKEIDTRQKVFDDLEKRILEADKKYYEEKKNEHFEAWLCDV